MLEELKLLVKEIHPEKGTYLVSCFLMDGRWNCDYYSEKQHKLWTYTKTNGKISAMEGEVFQKERKPLEKLDLKNVKVSDLSKYISSDVEKKVIVILQVINGKTTWNLTSVEKDFSVHNIKIDALTGEVVSDKRDSLLSFHKS